MTEEFNIHDRETDERLTRLFGEVQPSADFESKLINAVRQTPQRRMFIHPLVMKTAGAIAASLVVGSIGFVGNAYLQTGQLPAIGMRREIVRSASNLREIGRELHSHSNEDKGLQPREKFTNTATQVERANMPAAAGQSARLRDEQVNTPVEREAVVRELTKHVRNQVEGRNFAGALGTLDQILTIEPNNDYALGVRPLVEDRALLETQRQYREQFDRQTNRGYLDDKADKKTANSDILRYPENWPDLSKNRAETSGDYFFKPGAAPVIAGFAAEPTPELQLGRVLTIVPAADSAGRAEPAIVGLPMQEGASASLGEKLKEIAAEPAAPPVADPVAQQPPTTAVSRRKIIRNGDLEFEVDNFDAATSRLTTIVLEDGGYIATTNSDKLPNGKVKGTIIVRVAPDRLDFLVLKLRALGDLKRQALTAQDVTKQYYDLESDLRGAEAMQERLLEMIKSGKGEIKDLLEAEKELANWRGKIEKIKGELSYYSNLVSLSTLNITMFEKDIQQSASATELETADMGVESEDVEKSRSDAIKAIDDAKGRIIESSLKRFDAGQFAAKIVADVPRESAGAVIDRLKQLGKVARFDVNRQTTTQNPEGIAPTTRVEHKDTRIVVSIYNLANVAPRTTTNMSLACDNVEASFKQILERIAKANGRVVTSNVNRQKTEAGSATIQFEVKAIDADAIIGDVRAAGELMKSDTAQNPDTQNTTDSKRGVSIMLVSQAMTQPRQVTNRTVASNDVAATYEAILEAARSSGARIVVSQLTQQEQNQSSAQLSFEMKRDGLVAMESMLEKSGDVIAGNTSFAQENENVLNSKVRLDLVFTDAARLPARMTTTLGVETADVATASEKAAQAASSLGGRVLDSQITTDDASRSTARVLIEVPLGKSAEAASAIRSLGKVRFNQLTQNAQSRDGKLSRARLELTFMTPDTIVESGQGPWNTVKKGLSTSIAGLMWSLQFLVIGVCLIAPWVLLVVGGWKIHRRLRKKTAVIA